MTEKKYGIIGKPLSHSLSPLLHNFWFKKYNIKATYSLIETDINHIEKVINKIKKKELQGINVTIPYKQEVIPYLDLVINDAKQTSSVNTIYLNDENKIVGENTDVYGFNYSFVQKIKDKNLLEKNVLILGAGGVTPSIIYALFKKNIKKIFISNRTLEKAENIKKKFPFVEIILWEKINGRSQDMDIIINATSLGMQKVNNFNKVIEKFKTELIYYDVVYNPLETTILKKLKEQKVKTFNGLEMFLYQGQKSFYLWHGINPDVESELKKIITNKLK
jgi:shikimate dehydrogenase|tara:strand:+ start:1036 stop:1866 length:831 start_codon:yes stop_codon:yes gene_type:complete